MYKVGQVVQGTITGIKPYGAFVKIDEETSGLIHISEISEYYINDVSYFFKKGEKVVVKIIDIDKIGQLRLSLKAIQTNRKYAIPTKKDIANIEKIGFKSLQEKLPDWIKDALKGKL
ncbi:MAG: S1 RNA-binding domain-containing protein [Erysipelotrichia bacterium]|nr:S1 RNA-binding domain-containing protein [Erysipelotrichia bacterium]